MIVAGILSSLMSTSPERGRIHVREANETRDMRKTIPEWRQARRLTVSELVAKPSGLGRLLSKIAEILEQRFFLRRQVVRKANADLGKEIASFFFFRLHLGHPLTAQAEDLAGLRFWGD